MVLLLCLIWRCWGFCRAKSPTESPHGSPAQGYFSHQAGVSAIRASSAVCPFSTFTVWPVCAEHDAKLARALALFLYPTLTTLHRLKQDVLGTLFVDVVHSCTRIRLTELSIGPASRCVCNMAPFVFTMPCYRPISSLHAIPVPFRICPQIPLN